MNYLKRIKLNHIINFYLFMNMQIVFKHYLQQLKVKVEIVMNFINKLK